MIYMGDIPYPGGGGAEWLEKTTTKYSNRVTCITYFEFLMLSHQCIHPHNSITSHLIDFKFHTAIGAIYINLCIKFDGYFLSIS